jgi:hypothetical protein
MEVFDGLHGRLEQQLAVWKEIASTDVPAINERIRKENVSLVEVSSGKN